MKENKNTYYICEATIIGDPISCSKIKNNISQDVRKYVKILTSTINNNYSLRFVSSDVSEDIINIFKNNSCLVIIIFFYVKSESNRYGYIPYSMNKNNPQGIILFKNNKMKEYLHLDTDISINTSQSVKELSKWISILPEQVLQNFKEQLDFI